MFKFLSKTFKIFVLTAFSIAPLVVMAQTNVPDPLTRVGGGNFLVFVFDIFKFIVGFFAFVAFGFLVFNGFKLVIARDNQQDLTEAKDGLYNAVYGFAAALLSYTLIAGTSTFLGGTGANELENANNLQSGIGTFDLNEVFSRVILGLLGVTFLAALIMLVYGGTRLIFSAGNEEQVKSGKTIIRWSVGGIIVILLAYTIISIVNRVFTGQGP